ncbi:MAG: chemotaxis protein CheX [Thermoguttaceae bacterium]
MKDLEQKLTDVLEDTFASMAFVLPPAEEDEAESGEAANAHASITFSGPFSGELWISVSRSMLPVLAENIMGIEGSGATTGEEQEDALKEMLNVICGNLLPLIAPPKEVFHIHQPRFLATNEPLPAHDDDTNAKVQLRLDNGLVELSLRIRHPAEIVEA